MVSGIRWLLLEYSHAWDDATLLVSVRTDIRCHLWLYWTDVEQVMHNREKIIRGLSVLGDPKFCFVEWEKVEQNEDGDTLIHTFTFNTWGECQRRWWFFMGTIGGVDSPSNTATFTEHYKDVEFLTSIGIYGEADVLHGDVKLETGVAVVLTYPTPDHRIRIAG